MSVEDNGLGEIPPQCDTGEDASFDALVRGVANGSLSRRRALRLFGGALAASLLVFIPGMKDSGANVLASTNGNQTKATTANGQVQATTKGGGGGKGGGGKGGGGKGGGGKGGGNTRRQERRRDRRQERREELRQERRNGRGNKGGNSACAHFCEDTFPNDQALKDQCVSEAAHAQGICYDCGPQGTDPDRELCGQSCVELGTIQNCNGCGDVCTTNVANADPVCDNGNCDFECLTGFTEIDGACCANAAVCLGSAGGSQVCGCGTGNDCCGATNTELGICTAQGTIANCGGNCEVCTTSVQNAVPVCDNGQCDFECNAGFTRCGNQCVNAATDLNNCGSCGNVCTAPANATATCTAGQCGFTCNAGFTRCSNQCVTSANCPNNRPNLNPATCQCCNASGTQCQPVSTTQVTAAQITPAQGTNSASASASAAAEDQYGAP